ncbi:MAG: hypothetical protein AB2693_15710, partial [Candidatus Thiodiazotropha sp.]
MAKQPPAPTASTVGPCLLVGKYWKIQPLPPRLPHEPQTRKIRTAVQKLNHYKISKCWDNFSITWDNFSITFIH